MSTTGVGSSWPPRIARTLPACSTRYRVRSPGRVAIATGCSSWATLTRRTLAVRNWALEAVLAPAVVEGASLVVVGISVVELTLVVGAACPPGSFPEQAAASRARTRMAVGPRLARRMAAIVVGRGEV